MMAGNKSNNWCLWEVGVGTRDEIRGIMGGAIVWTRGIIGGDK